MSVHTGAELGPTSVLGGEVGRELLGVGARRRPSRTRRLRLAVIGLTGSGKSTTASLLSQALRRRGLTVAVVKLATPLYRLQEAVYATAGVALDAGTQDQVLLESMARHLRRIAPRAIVDDFLLRLDGVDAEVVLNDDLRDPWVDWPALRDAGFEVVRVIAPEPTRLARLDDRGDLTLVRHSTSTAHLDEIIPDTVIVNQGTIADLRAAVERLLEERL